VLFLKSVFFTLLLPGTVTVLLPYVIVGSPEAAAVTLDAPWGLSQYVGLILIATGAAVLLWSIVDFALHGRGTLAPVDPPKELVVRGPYCFVRNPMYLGVLTVLLGESVFFRSASLLWYAILVLIVFVVVILAYEEPVLRAQFGESYARYVSSVRRWIPGRPYRG
jgi:protein-S-isoprenylcysteine O-methyltransferase Ste14